MEIWKCKCKTIGNDSGKEPCTTYNNTQNEILSVFRTDKISKRKRDVLQNNNKNLGLVTVAVSNKE